MDHNAVSADNLIQSMEHWGYTLLPKPHPLSPGHAGLRVAIRDVPTGKHFDPEALWILVVQPSGSAECVTLDLKKPTVSSYRVGPGKIILRDRLKKQQEFFTFGGALEWESTPGEIVYSLRSPAPVLRLNATRDEVADQLAAEVGAIIGRWRAKWGGNDDGFLNHLAQVDPLELYVAMIRFIVADYARTESLHESSKEFYQMLLQERHWLEETDEWTKKVATLEQLLTPN